MQNLGLKTNILKSIRGKNKTLSTYGLLCRKIATVYFSTHDANDANKRPPFPELMFAFSCYFRFLQHKQRKQRVSIVWRVADPERRGAKSREDLDRTTSLLGLPRPGNPYTHVVSMTSTGRTCSVRPEKKSIDKNFNIFKDPTVLSEIFS